MASHSPEAFFAQCGIELSALKDADRLIAAARSICVVGHIRPDADAIGSVCALVDELRREGMTAHGLIGQVGPFESTLLSIPGAAEVACVDALPSDCDLVITVDCGDLGRTGTLAKDITALAAAGKVIVVDHHATNPGQGSVNIIAPDVESTTMVLWQWWRLSGRVIGDVAAQCLYAGLLTDTGCFRFGGARMHHMAEQLLDRGINPRQVAYDLLDKTDPASLTMTGEVLSKMTVVSAGSEGPTLCVLPATHDIIADHDMAAVEALTNYVRAVEGTDFGVLLKEYVPGTFQVSFRSHSLVISSIAAHLGGGGHDNAAGATIHADSAAEAVELIRRATAEVYPSA